MTYAGNLFVIGDVEKIIAKVKRYFKEKLETEASGGQ